MTGSPKGALFSAAAIIVLGAMTVSAQEREHGGSPVGDSWLFALQVPPAGYEWVRDDTDALLVNLQTGEILQVEYGVFA